SARAADRLLDLSCEFEGYLADGEGCDLPRNDAAAFQLRGYELLTHQPDRIGQLQQPVWRLGCLRHAVSYLYGGVERRVVPITVRTGLVSCAGDSTVFSLRVL